MSTRSLTVDLNTWTPSLQFGGATTGLTYSYRYGFWYQIGGLLHAECYFGLSSKGTATGAATITGLPVVSAPNSGQFTAATLRLDSYASLPGAPQSYIGPAQTTVILEYLGSTGALMLSDTHCTNSTSFMLTAVYRV